MDLDKIYNEHKNKFKIAAVILSLFFVGIILYYRVNLYFFREETYGIVTGFRNDVRGRTYVKYEFVVNGETYKDSSRLLANPNPKIGETYIVVYSYVNPNISFMKFTKE